jgi:hypothetical protein
MTLLQGITEAGTEVPVLVDSAGRLVAITEPDPGALPQGGELGQVLTKTGPTNYQADWADAQFPLAKLPGFMLRKDGIDSVPSGAPGLLLPFEPSPVFMDGAEFDPVTARITPKIAGWWFINAKYRCNGAALDIRCRVSMNTGVDFSQQRMHADGLLPARVSINSPWYFNGTSDYFTIWAEHRQGAVVSIDKSEVFGQLMYAG